MGTRYGLQSSVRCRRGLARSCAGHLCGGEIHRGRQDCGRSGNTGQLHVGSAVLQVHGHFIAPADQAEQDLGQAIDLATEAVSADPDNAEAHVRLATSIGRHAAAIGSFEASNPGCCTRIREAAERALAFTPKMAEAHLAMGCWHAGVIDALRSLVAGMFHDASEDAASGHFERAPELQPDGKTIVLECAIGLLVLDDGSEHARNLPVRSIGMGSRDAAENLRHAEAIERLEAPGWSPDPQTVNP